MRGEVLRFGIVGTNFISDAFVRAARLSEKCEPFAIYSRTKERGEDFAKRNGLSRVYLSFDEMLSDSEIDAVYIASPTFLHKDMACKALRAGKHALIEKMIALTHGEFLEIKRSADFGNSHFLEAMRPNFDKSFALVEEKLTEIGKIKEVYFEFCQYSSRYDNFKRGIIENAFNPELKNSALADIGIYPLHLAIRLFGEPTSIEAKSSFLENGFEAEGDVSLSYGDFTVNIRYSKIFEGENRSYIKGENGLICFDKINAPKLLSIELNGCEALENYTPEENNILSEIDAFCDTVLGERKYLRFNDVSEKTMRTVDKIYKASGISYL